MRVVWLVPGFRADEQDWFIPALYLLARRLRGECDLQVVTLRYPARQGSHAVGGIPVHSVGADERGFRALFRAWSRAAAVVRQLRPEILHAYWVLDPGVVAAWFRRRVPVLITAAGGEAVHLPGIGYGLAGGLRNRLLMRWAMRGAAAVSALSNDYAAQVGRFLGGPPVLCTPWGIEPKAWRGTAGGAAANLILNVGSLERVKGLDVLLEAFALVRQRVPSARLRLVGDGSQRSALRETARGLRCADAVEMSGWVRHEKLPDVYSAAGVFAQSSHFESQGMAVLEAAASGLPLAGTNVGVLAGLAPRAAVAVAPGDPRALADAVTELLVDRERARRLAGQAKETVREEYSVEAAAGGLLELYGSLRKAGSDW